MNIGTFEAWRPKNRDGGAAADAKEWAAANGLRPEDDNAFNPVVPGSGGSSLAQLAAGQAGKSSVPAIRSALFLKIGQQSRPKLSPLSFMRWEST